MAINTDNIDRFGHCVVCHKNLITKRIVDGVIVDMFLPIHDHVSFILNDGSLMKVCMCKPCKETTDLKDVTVKSNIMDAVNKGWQLETKLLVADPYKTQWTQEFADDYLNKMSKLEIHEDAKSFDKIALQEKSKELSTSFREAQK